MNFNEKKVNGAFDEMFDLDGDGMLDLREQKLQMSYLIQLGREMDANDELEEYVYTY